MSAADIRITEEAAEWLVRMTADTGNAGLRDAMQQDFDRWKAADPRHAQVADRMENLIGQLQGVRNEAPRRATYAALDAVNHLYRKQKRIRQGGVTLLLLASLMLPCWMLVYGITPDALVADMHTRKGEWKTWQLADGSSIVLGSNSAVSLDFSDSQRVIVLDKGEVLAHVAHDSQRPFIIKTQQGNVRALGTVFSVAQAPQHVTVTMLESRVRVSPQKAPGQSTEIHAGQRLQFSDDHIEYIEAIDPQSLKDAWAQQQLVVDDKPLPEVLAIIARHRPGVLYYNAEELQHYRVSAVLPLDDTDHALTLLADSLPLHVQYLSSFIVRVSP